MIRMWQKKGTNQICEVLGWKEEKQWKDQEAMQVQLAIPF